MSLFDPDDEDPKLDFQIKRTDRQASNSQLSMSIGFIVN